MKGTQDPHTSRRQSRNFVLGSLAVGHGVSHLMSQAFPLLLTEISVTMGLNTVQKATLLAMRQVGPTAANLGGGPVIDMVKPHWGPILAASMLWSAISFAIVGTSPGFVTVAFGIVLIAIPGSLWHLPAGAAISQRFPDRRGFAISIHGFGSNIGNVLSPIIAGALLGVFLWRYVFYLYIVPSLLVALFVWWALRELGRYGAYEKPKNLKVQFQEALSLMQNRTVLRLVAASLLLTAGLDTLIDWTPFYLKEEDGLGMGDLKAGIYYSLLVGMGIVSSPILGVLSDRYGRKVILLSGLSISAFLSFVVVSTDDSLLLIPVMGGIGLFGFSLFQIIQAAVLDVVGRGTEAKAIGLLFGINGVVGISTPFLVSVIIDHLGGYSSIYYYAGLLVSAAALVMLLIPMNKPQASAPQPAS